MTVMGLKTLLELRGISCLQLDDIAYEKQSITVARSFGRLVIERRELEEAVASYMTTAAHKMRAQHMVVQRIAVFVVSVSYHEEYMRNYHTMQYILPVATAYTPTLITAAKYCVQSLYRQGLRYKKAGVILMKFASSTQVQMNMYASIHNTNKQKELMHIVDHINTKWGNHTLTFASQGTKQPWKMKQAKKSPRFTTSWHELLKLTI
jgi:DNA polymerase V